VQEGVRTRNWWIYRLPNNYGVSVVQIPSGISRIYSCTQPYGTEDDETYEIGIIRFTGPGWDDWDLTRENEISDGWPDGSVTAWRSAQDITDILRKLAEIGTRQDKLDIERMEFEML
jgi:hypothetical protein